MSGGGKGGSSTTSVQIPAWLENAAQQNLARADRVSQIGYTPYFGPDVAAFTPMQEASMNNTNQAALSFGMAAPTSAMAGIPAAQTFAGGVQGYSSAPLYQQSVEALRTNAPGQYDAMRQMFIDPITGAAPMYPFGMGVAPGAPMAPGPQGFDWTSSNSQNASERAERAVGGGGGAMRTGGGSIMSGQIASRMPGGVNTANPGSLVNRTAAAVTSRPQRAPTAANRPKARPTGR
jgi:hypothetical protein